MLTGGYELVHRAMGAKAAATVWEAETLARRHGHARVTPLHVASAILSSSVPEAEARSLLLLLSSSGPQQLRPEDLRRCFDAVLSRFPVASKSHPHIQLLAPSLPMSNALVAALNRAQLLQLQCSLGRCRRGGGRRRQLANVVKIELEQLVHSIVVDPGVYRAMEQARSGIPFKPTVMEKGASPEAPPTLSLCGVENLHQPIPANLSSHNSGEYASQGKTREELAPFAAGQSAATPSLPSWLQAAKPTFRSTSGQATCLKKKFMELTATNYKKMCDTLERHVPQHKDIAHGIASAVLLSRSGMITMSNTRSSASSTMTWLLFQGRDHHGKKVMANQLSNLIFGPCSEVFVLDCADNSSPGTGYLSNKRKRSRDNDNTYVMRKLLEAIQENPHRVVFIRAINHQDIQSKIPIQNLIATGRVMGCNGSDMVDLEDAIVVLSTEETSSSRTMATSTLMNRQIINIQSHKDKGVESLRLRLDLNACAEDVGEEEEIFVGDNVDITTVVDGVFHFD